jgi:hypothetical protein
MNQYEKVHADFSFLGAVTMDFDKIPQLGIADLDLEKEYNNGKKRFGIIFNLDEHWQSGSHWVAAFIDLEKGINIFNDSYGIAPTPEVRKLLRKFSKFSEQKLGIRAEATHNKTKHQQGGSECGMYSLNFIISLLEGKPLDNLTETKIPDAQVNKLRPIFFHNVEFDNNGKILPQK